MSTFAISSRPFRTLILIALTMALSTSTSLEVARGDTWIGELSAPRSLFPTPGPTIALYVESDGQPHVIHLPSERGNASWALYDDQGALLQGPVQLPAFQRAALLSVAGEGDVVIGTYPSLILPGQLEICQNLTFVRITAGSSGQARNVSSAGCTFSAFAVGAGSTLALSMSGPESGGFGARPLRATQLDRDGLLVTEREVLGDLVAFAADKNTAGELDVVALNITMNGETSFFFGTLRPDGSWSRGPLEFLRRSHSNLSSVAVRSTPSGRIVFWSERVSSQFSYYAQQLDEAGIAAAQPLLVYVGSGPLFPKDLVADGEFVHVAGYLREEGRLLVSRLDYRTGGVVSSGQSVAENVTDMHVRREPAGISLTYVVGAGNPFSVWAQDASFRAGRDGGLGYAPILVGLAVASLIVLVAITHARRRTERGEPPRERMAGGNP